MKQFTYRRCVNGVNHICVMPVVLTLVAVAWLTPVFGEAAPQMKDRLLNDIKYLASDELEGRGVGTKGLSLAADYVRRQFEKAGLDVTRINGRAFQSFTMVIRTKLGTTNRLQLVGPDDELIELKLDTDFRTCSFGGSGTFQGELVFAGYAIDAKDEKYNDFESIDLKHKVIVIMRRSPQQGNSHGPFSVSHGGLSRHAELRTKVSNAFQAGAAAIVFVNDPYTNRKNGQQDLRKTKDRVVTAAIKVDAIDPNNSKNLNEARQKLSESLKRVKTLQTSAKNAYANAITDPLMNFGYGPISNTRTIPIFHVTQKTVNQLLGKTLKTSLAEIEAQIDKDLKPRSAVLTGWSAKGTTAVEQVKAKVKNVVGVLEGTGPLADETIVIGAHYDHIGMGGLGSLASGSKEVHNGADDNASGTVSLVELARRLARRKEKLPRRLVFIAFTAEESGLIGSARYVRKPVFPLENTIAMFNMDMVGRLRDDKLTVFGMGTATRWKHMIEDLSKDHLFKLTMKPGGFGPSDHSSFYGKQVPVLHFFTGTHSDYHRPGDDWQKINVEGMIRIIDVIEQVIVTTAQTKERPNYVEVKRQHTASHSGNRPYFGSIPDFGTDMPGYAISGTTPDSPAAKGGLRNGDVIVRLGNHQIGWLGDFDLALRKFAPGDEVIVTVLRDGNRVILTVQLDKPR